MQNNKRNNFQEPVPMLIYGKYKKWSNEKYKNVKHFGTSTKTLDD